MNREIIKYLGGRFIPAIVNLALIVLAIRFIGPEEYGRYSLILYAVILILTLGFHWVQVSILRFLGCMPRETGTVMSRFFDLTILTALASTALVVVVCIFYFHLPAFELILVALFSFLNHFYLFHQAILQAYHRSVRTAILEGSDQLIVMIVLLLGLFVFRWETSSLLFVSLVIGLAGVLLLRVFIREKGLLTVDLKHLYWDSRFSAKVVEYGYGITLWLFLSHLLAAADRFVIMEYRGYADAGMYAALKDLLFKGITFASLPIYLSYQARITTAWNSRHRKDSWDSIKEALSFEMLIFILVFIVFMVSKEMLFRDVLQVPALENWLIYLPLLLAAFLWQGALLMQRFLELTIRQWHLMTALAGVVILNLVLNLVFLPVYGMAASSLALLGSVTLYAAFVTILSWRTGRKLARQE